MNFANYFTRTPFDGVLIPELAKALQKPEAKPLIVLPRVSIV